MMAQYNRAKTLLSSVTIEEISIHGLGAAVNRAIELALKLIDENRDLSLFVSTSTVKLIDDYEPLVDVR
jgi:hypothetical protein